MPRIRCYYEGCVYHDGAYCRAERIELDVEQGCLTFARMDDLPLEDDDWKELFEGDEGFIADDDDDDYDPSEWN